MALVRKYKKAERTKSPEVQEFVGAIVEQFVRAIEDEGADGVIIASPHQQCFLDEVRQGLDVRGYQEVNLIGAFPAAVEMARSMVNMKLKQSPRAYPTDALKAKPAFRYREPESPTVTDRPPTVHWLAPARCYPESLAP